MFAYIVEEARGANSNFKIFFCSPLVWLARRALLKTLMKFFLKGKSAGITSVHFESETHGLITGGDLTITDAYTDNLAFSKDGGQTWTLTNHPVTKGIMYALKIYHLSKMSSGGQPIFFCFGFRFCMFHVSRN